MGASASQPSKVAAKGGDPGSPGTFKVGGSIKRFAQQASI